MISNLNLFLRFFSKNIFRKPFITKTVIMEKAPAVTIAQYATLTLKTVGLTLTILMGGDIKGIWVLIHINFQNHRSQV